MNRFWRIVLFFSLGDASASDDKKKVKIDPKEFILILMYFRSDTNYLLYASNDTLLIPVFLGETDCACQYYVPNGFSPDGDEFNEYFFPVINCDYIELQMTIYDRTNQVVFHSNELNPRWNGENHENGRESMSGQYVYHITMRRESGEEIEIIGFVMLFR